MGIRVRFAPSPTGYLHVGGARTALFNWLYARRHGGTFVLRIEDTDVERSSEEMVRASSTACAGWASTGTRARTSAGRTRRTSSRSGSVALPRMAERLVAAGHAYYCYRTPEDDDSRSGRPSEARRRRLAARPRRAARSPPSRPPSAQRDGRAARDPLQGARRDGRPSPISVHGPIEFDNAHIEDFVILRSDGHPTYHLSVVVDDIDMQITHVVRGDDHISNTPKQVLLYHAFGGTPPAVRARAAHPRPRQEAPQQAPRRHLGDGVRDGRATCRRRWSTSSPCSAGRTGNDHEMFTRDELVARFALEGIRGGNAVFNTEKLDWFNHQHLMRLGDEDLARRIEPACARPGSGARRSAGEHREWLLRVLELLKPRAHRLGTSSCRPQPLLADRVEMDPAAAARHLAPAGTRAHVEAVAAHAGRRRRVHRGPARAGAARPGRVARREGGHAASTRPAWR